MAENEQQIFDPRRREFQALEKKRIRITPDAFVADGNSLLAREFAQSWTEAREEGDLTAIFGCSDARFVYNPKNAIGFRSISAAVPELYEPGNVLSREFGTRIAVVAAHHDGTTVGEGIRPKGCGGREEKAKMRNGQQLEEPKGAARYVEQNVVHEDPLIAACFSTIRIAERTGLPVLGTTQDHRTGELVVLNAAMPTSRGGVEILSKISLSQLLEGQYREEQVYAEGIPALEKNKIPDDFFPFLRRHDNYIKELKERHPDLEATQAVQNPDTVLLTSVVRPSRGRLPTLSGSSANRVFAITVARTPDDPSQDVAYQSLQDASDELEYPLLNGLNSEGNSSLPFSSLYGNGTVILETRNMSRSRRLASELLERPWFHQWTEIPGNKILVAQTTKGIVDHAEYFKSAR